MSKYKFGDTFIKEDKAVIVIDYSDKTYYLQTKAGNLITRSQDELDDMVNKLDYQLVPQLCNPKFISHTDFHIGDMVIGRKENKYGGYGIKKRVGIVIGKTVRRSIWFRKERTHYIRIMWSDTGERETFNFNNLYSRFNKYWYANDYHMSCWKLIPVVK
jgi:hypothetical protein